MEEEAVGAHTLRHRGGGEVGEDVADGCTILDRVAAVVATGAGEGEGVALEGGAVGVGRPDAGVVADVGLAVKGGGADGDGVEVQPGAGVEGAVGGDTEPGRWWRVEEARLDDRGEQR